jgi:hypothetical protein
MSQTPFEPTHGFPYNCPLAAASGSNDQRVTAAKVKVGIVGGVRLVREHPRSCTRSRGRTWRSRTTSVLETTHVEGDCPLPFRRWLSFISMPSAWPRGRSRGCVSRFGVSDRPQILLE